MIEMQLARIVIRETSDQQSVHLREKDGEVVGPVKGSAGFVIVKVEATREDNRSFLPALRAPPSVLRKELRGAFTCRQRRLHHSPGEVLLQKLVAEYEPAATALQLRLQGLLVAWPSLVPPL